MFKLPVLVSVQPDMVTNATVLYFINFLNWEFLKLKNYLLNWQTVYVCFIKTIQVGLLKSQKFS